MACLGLDCCVETRVITHVYARRVSALEKIAVDCRKEMFRKILGEKFPSVMAGSRITRKGENKLEALPKKLQILLQKHKLIFKT